MNKRRITLNLDADIVEALEQVEGRSLSDTVNRALREAAASIAHRRALLDWLAELNEEHGVPTEVEYADADAFLDEVFGPDPRRSVA